jgi:hypothetical protein
MIMKILWYYLVPKVLKEEANADELKNAYKKAAEEKNAKVWWKSFRWLWSNESL